MADDDNPTMTALEYVEGLIEEDRDAAIQCEKVWEHLRICQSIALEFLERHNVGEADYRRLLAKLEEAAAAADAYFDLDEGSILDEPSRLARQTDVAAMIADRIFEAAQARRALEGEADEETDDAQNAGRTLN